MNFRGKLFSVWNICHLIFLIQASCTESKDSVTKVVDQALEDAFDGSACKDLQLSRLCTITNNCTYIKCTGTLGNVPTTLSASIDRCEESVTISTNLKVSKSDFDWSHQFKSNETVGVSGFHIQTASSAGLGLFLNVFFTKQLDSLDLEMTFQFGAVNSSFKESQLMNKKLPFSNTGCEFLNWWYAKPSALRIVILLAIAVGVLVMLTGCCCCCCYPCRRKLRKGRFSGNFVI